jgi:hypothetical protein
MPIFILRHKMIFSTTKGRHDTQLNGIRHNDTQHGDTQHNNTQNNNTKR